jgi:hypothetical protein
MREETEVIYKYDKMVIRRKVNPRRRFLTVPITHVQVDVAHTRSNESYTSRKPERGVEEGMAARLSAHKTSKNARDASEGLGILPTIIRRRNDRIRTKNIFRNAHH